VRSHFKHSIEVVDDHAEIVDQLAGVQDFMLAKATATPRVRMPGAISFTPQARRVQCTHPHGALAR
jgi:hypothetical protein